MSLMQIPRKIEYALRAMIHLADHPSARGNEIAEQERIPKYYLEKVIRDLMRRGLVNARFQASRGYAAGQGFAAGPPLRARNPNDELRPLTVGEARAGPRSALGGPNRLGHSDGDPFGRRPAWTLRRHTPGAIACFELFAPGTIGHLPGSLWSLGGDLNP